MSTFSRSKHVRTNRYGTTFQVREHHVRRDEWSLGQPGEARAFKADGAGSGSLLVPNAHCPVCGGLVWYFESVEGGRVFFDTVWPDWEKHPCTDNGARVVRAAPATSAEPLALPEVEIYPRAAGTILGLRHTDGSVDWVKSKLPAGERFFPVASLRRNAAGEINRISLQSADLVPYELPATRSEAPGAITQGDRVAYAEALQKDLIACARKMTALEGKVLVRHDALGPFIAGHVGASRVAIIPLLVDHYRAEVEAIPGAEDPSEAASQFMKDAALAAHRALAQKIIVEGEHGANQVIFVTERSLIEVEEFSAYAPGQLDQFGIDTWWYGSATEARRAKIGKVLVEDLSGAAELALSEIPATVGMLVEAEEQWVQRAWAMSEAGQMTQILEMAQRIGYRELLQKLIGLMRTRGWIIDFAYRGNEAGQMHIGSDRRSLQFDANFSTPDSAGSTRLMFHMSSKANGLVFLEDPEDDDAVATGRLFTVRNSGDAGRLPDHLARRRTRKRRS
ncbi:hypothetical protein [Bosea sp. ANAM02]|uniref:hypothetical protein n=1 Tax=Bosea sp. ANAM02 TaxID=2020412 RepID=UPI00140EE53A|nr:hypothetical protein [Bosea sp. ANAM02]BCB22430.1 hypothetical protein OCUBac02_53240 [Bosea sp. ANAM02]